MAKLFLREVVVTIFPSSGETKKIEGMRVSFNAEKTSEANPNTMEVRIYNLGEATRSALEGDKTRVILEAGYEETIETIFQGNITRVVHEKNGPDIISNVEVADGGNKYRNARIEKGFPPGVKTKQVVDELVGSVGLPRGSITGVPNAQYANGITLSGFAKDRLNDIVKKNSLEWSIQNEAVQIVPVNGTTKESEILISSETGLIGSPGKTKEGIEFKSLLQPRLTPGRRVRLESKFINGTFKITKVNHNGDNHSGDFLSECEAKGLGTNE